MRKDWVKVFKTTNGFEADIMSDVLENHGIPNVKLDQKDSSYQTFGVIEIYVHEQYFSEAIEVITKASDE